MFVSLPSPFFFSRKYDFGLPINIEEMIDALGRFFYTPLSCYNHKSISSFCIFNFASSDEDGSGEIEWLEFKELFTSPQQNHEF